MPFRTHATASIMAHVEIIGVHPIEVTDELVQEAFEVKYGYLEDPDDALQLAREEVESVVLIEALVKDRDDRFDVAHFGQSQGDKLAANDQVAYDEIFLSDDGTSVIARGQREVGAGDLRIAFFLHFYQDTRPLLTSYGSVPLPPKTPMPQRLSAITKYEPV
jgi:hypothetical protein